MSPLPPPCLYNPQTDKLLLPQIASLHAHCITHDSQLLTFLPPLSHSKILESWLEWSEQVEKGTRLIFLQLSKTQEAEGGKEGGNGEGTVAGVVSLAMPVSETGKHRCEVGRLCVAGNFRMRGVARRLMEVLESEARERGKWLVMLDTTLGSGAERVYPKLGYKEVGMIPNYGFSPKDGKLMDEMFYYKDLRQK